MNRWLGFFFACVAYAAASRPSAALAQAQSQDYSQLERSVIDEQLARLGLDAEPEPEGKRIEDVRVVTLDVFDHRDPVPDFVNVFHATTRERVIRRELLFETGSPYRGDLAYETARNLRELPQLSIVLVVPVKGSAPNRVRVLVITKDVWSLRLNWSVSGLHTLILNPAEENLFGTHTSLGALFIIDPKTYSLGATVSHRRLFGSRIMTSVAASLIRNRDTGDNEGSFGELRYGQPLYSLDTKWSWGTSVLWRHDIGRRYTGLNVSAYDAQVTPQDDRIPVTYDRDIWYGGYEVVRSFGRRFKLDVSLGIEASRGVFGARDLSQFDPRAAAEFIRVKLPTSDQRISPFVQLHAHRTDFDSLLDVESLGLQEDFRRGHDLLLRMYAASNDLGSTRDLLGAVSVLSYTLPVGDGFVRPLLGSRIELANRGRDDALFEADLRFVSPRLGFGRFVLDGQVLDRARDYLNREFALGNETRLRGYARSNFQGTNLVVANAELRTTSIDVLSAQVGGALFYDIGDTPRAFDQLKLKQDVGLGVRVLFPQFDRVVFRADWGFPVFSPGYSSLPGAFYFSFRQAFPVPTVAAPSVLTETLN